MSEPIEQEVIFNFTKRYDIYKANKGKALLNPEEKEKVFQGSPKNNSVIEIVKNIPEDEDKIIKMSELNLKAPKTFNINLGF